MVPWHGASAVSGGIVAGITAGIRTGRAGRRKTSVSGAERRQCDLPVPTAVLFGGAVRDRQSVLCEDGVW